MLKINPPSSKRSNLDFHEILVKHQTAVTIFSEWQLCVSETKCRQHQCKTWKATVGKFCRTGKTKTIMRKYSYKTSDPKFKMLKREDNANRQHKGH